MNELLSDLERIKGNLKEASRYVLSQPAYVKAHMEAAVGDIEGVIRRASGSPEHRGLVRSFDEIRDKIRDASGGAWDGIDDPAEFLGRD